MYGICNSFVTPVNRKIACDTYCLAGAYTSFSVIVMFESVIDSEGSLTELSLTLNAGSSIGGRVQSEESIAIGDSCSKLPVWVTICHESVDVVDSVRCRRPGTATGIV